MKSKVWKVRIKPLNVETKFFNKLALLADKK